MHIGSRIVFAALVIGVAAAAPGLARAQAFISGNDLAKACAANSREPAACNAFIAGALDEVETSPEMKAKICLPAGTKLRTLRESVASYAAERPEAVRGSGVAMLNAMVTSRFPCK